VGVLPASDSGVVFSPKAAHWTCYIFTGDETQATRTNEEKTSNRRGAARCLFWIVPHFGRSGADERANARR
jgi:hypothetical protein